MTTSPDREHAPEDERLLEHSYDGIQEYDNPMPKWWLWGLYASIVYAVIYVIDPTGVVSGQDWHTEYAAEQAAFAAAHPVAAQLDPQLLVAAADDDARAARGTAVYVQYCAACHRADGGGLIGPNLTDDYWLHGSTAAAIYRTIDEGVLAQGMPAWGKLLTQEQRLDVLAYVSELNEKDAPDGKAPQGERASDDDDTDDAQPPAPGR